MSVYAPNTSAIAAMLAGLNISQVWIGGELYFGEVVPPPSELTYVETQAEALVGVTTANVPIQGMNILEGDTVIVITRSDTATPASASLAAGNPVTRIGTRSNGLNDTLSVWKFTAVAAQAGASSFDMTLNVSASTYASVMVIRGKDLTGVYGVAGATNASPLTVFSTTVPTTNGQSVLVGAFNSSTTAPASITSSSSNFPINGNIGVPKTGITGFVCFVDSGDLANGFISSAPVANGQMILGMWLN